MGLTNKILEKISVKFGAILILISIISGCDEAEFFVHDSTHELRNGVEQSDFGSHDKYVDNEILFVPDFANFSESFDYPSSALRLYSFTSQTVYIRDAVIKSDGVSDRVINIDEAISVDRRGGGYLYQIVQILNYENLSSDELIKYLNAGSLTLILSYSDTLGSTVKQMTYDLILKSRKDIKWGT